MNLDIIRNMNGYIPHIVETSGRTERSFDVFSRLLEERIIMIFGNVTNELVERVFAQMLSLRMKDNHKEIFLVINSGGGSISAGKTLVDFMQILECPVVTVCVGMAASMAAIFLACGTRRLIFPSAAVMIHQPSSGFEGVLKDMQIHVAFVEKEKKILYEILQKRMNKSYEEIEVLCERDRFFNAEEALEAGLVDAIVKFSDTNEVKSKESFTENLFQA